VDAYTGRVTSFGYAPPKSGNPGPIVVSKETAAAVAAQFLSKHSVDVASLSESAAPTYQGWEFTWERQLGDVGVPPRVIVTVEWQTGSVVGFSETRVDLGMPPAAVITRAQAEAIALGTWLTTPKVEDSRLRLEPYGPGGSTLVWEVYISGKGDGPDPAYIDIRIDALTGQPG
jgi:hypothetical protein